jgi:hypothetical protein
MYLTNQEHRSLQASCMELIIMAPAILLFFVLLLFFFFDGLVLLLLWAIANVSIDPSFV